jgi:EpsI family protein
MKNRWMRYGILFALLLCAAVFSLLHLFSSGKGEARVDMERVIPLRLPTWEGRDLSLEPGTLRLLGTENVLFRKYAKAGAKDVLLCLTLSGGDHRIAHPAEVCYEGQGWEVAINEELNFSFTAESPEQGRKVNHLRILKEKTVLEVIVWYRTSSYDTASFIRQKFGMMFSRLFGQSRWSAMIRISAPADKTGSDRALEAIKDFGKELMPYLDALNRHLEAE